MAGRKHRSYGDLITEFPLRPIRTDSQLERAGQIAFRLATQGSLSRDEQDYLDVLSDLVEKYEDEHHPLPENISGVEALQFLIEENGLTVAKLSAKTGIRASTLSEILNGKRSLGLRHIQKLCAYFRAAPSLFLDVPATIPSAGDS